MSPRYYIGTTVLIGVLTFVISFWKKKQRREEIFKLFIKIAAVFGAIIAGVLALASFLSFLGIAQSGFIL